MAALAISCATDGMLGIVAPLAMAGAAGTALLVDLDPLGPRYPGSGSLAELVDRGPRLDDLRPGSKGVAVLRNGGIDPADAREVMAALVRGWPSVVLRLPPATVDHAGPTVPVVPLLPGGMTPSCDRPAVYQQMGWHLEAPGPGLTMRTPSRATVAALCEGRLPPRSRWLRSWRRVWGMSWA